MKKCSFCGKENHDDAKFCTNCGRTFVIKELRKNLGKTFEITAYVAIALGFLAFIFELISMILGTAIFIDYVMWLVKYFMLGVVSIAFLYAHKIKSETLSLYTTQTLITHALVFFAGVAPYTHTFADFNFLYNFLFIFLLLYLATGVIFHHLKIGLSKFVLKYYHFISAFIVITYALLTGVGVAVHGFTTNLFMAFFGLYSFFYLGALGALLILPLIDKTIDVVERQGELREEHSDVETQD